MERKEKRIKGNFVEMKKNVKRKAESFLGDQEIQCISIPEWDTSKEKWKSQQYQCLRRVKGHDD